MISESKSSIPLFTLKTVLLLLHVDQKNTPEHMVLDFVIEPRFSSSFNLLGQSQADPSKGIFQSKLKNMNPAEVDNRNLEIDPLKKFETMGPTDVAIDLKTYRLKVTGKVERPLSLSYDEILKYPN